MSIRRSQSRVQAERLNHDAHVLCKVVPDCWEAMMFNLPELLRTIAEDYGDRGCEITYDGTKHVTFQGRPFALKRIFENLVDNA
jgi:hypothetical protein